MNIRIDDDVPLPEPDKPSTWISTPTTNREGGNWVEDRVKGEWTTGKPGPITEVGLASDWVTGGKIERTTFDPPLTVMPEWNPGPKLEYCPQCGNGAKHVGEACANCGSRYPSQTLFDDKGVPTVDCYLVGGPLNGKHGPIVGSAKVVELNMYAADGSVSSVELYELGDRGDLGARYWKGTKQ